MKRISLYFELIPYFGERIAKKVVNHLNEKDPPQKPHQTSLQTWLDGVSEWGGWNVRRVAEYRRTHSIHS